MEESKTEAQRTSDDVSDEEFIVRWKGPSGEEEGPLYVLWQLIESYRIDIFEISIHRITEDFLNFIERARSLRMELASSFVLMASRLVYYKSKALLPDPGFEEPENESRLPPELIEQLLEYRRFQLAAETFREMEDLTAFMLSRPPVTQASAREVEEQFLDVVDLVEAYLNVMRRIEKANQPEPVMEIAGEEMAVEDRMARIRELLAQADGFDFFDLFDNLPVSRMLIVVTVLAILELARLRELVIVQNATFSEIRIYRRSAVVR